MLRIARVDDGGSHSIRTLKLDGKLRGPWVGELRRACDELQTSPSDLRLDLSAVTFIDAVGLILLDDLIRQGATIAGCSGFVQELLSGGRDGALGAADRSRMFRTSGLTSSSGDD
jgi:ABC-type transporter Mla MlaB component